MLTVQRSLLLCDGGEIPTIGLGTWTIFGKHGNQDQVKRAVETAITAGYRHFDCAWSYMNEEGVGEAIKEKIKDGTVRREDLFITTKLWERYHNPNTVKTALENSLRNLQTSYVDMFLIHWPAAVQDGEVKFREVEDMFPKDKDGKVIFAHHSHVDVWKAMEECQKKGLTRHIGLSNFNSRQITNILNNCTIKPATLQIEISPYFSNKRLVSFCKERDIVVTGYAPFASPTYVERKPGDPSPWDEPVLMDIAAAKSKSIAQILLRFHLQNGVVVIPKSVTPSRIQENIQVFDFELSDDEMQRISSLDRNLRAYINEKLMDHPEYPFHEPF